MAPADLAAYAIDRPGRLVVIVEDDAGLRGALERVLRTAGYEPLAWATAEAALAHPGLVNADCLVIDVSLPGLSGLELLDRLRTGGVQTPAVVITAQDLARVREEVGRRGDHFLAKPFLGSALVQAIDSAIHSGTAASNPV